MYVTAINVKRHGFAREQETIYRRVLRKEKEGRNDKTIF